MEFKTFFLVLETVLNFSFPLIWFKEAFEIYKTKPIIVVLYLITVLIPILGLLIIFIKQKINYKTFIYKPYKPTILLITFIAILDIFSNIFMYFYLKNNITDKNKVFKVYISGFLHLGTSFLIYILILTKKERENKLISYSKHKYRLGIISRNMDGLSQGQPVEIIQDTIDGYIIKDSNDQNFEVKKDDLEDIMNVI